MVGAGYKIFISHSSADAWIAKLLRRAILTTGATCFLDTVDLKPGDQFKQVIRDNIVSSDELLVVMTRQFKGSKWRDFEIGVAEGAQRAISITPLLVRLAPGEINDDDFLRDRHAVDIDEIDEYLRGIEFRVNRRQQANQVRELQQKLTDEVKKFRGDADG